MKMDLILGLQWGDEGKGKVVDVLTPRYKMIARFQGGPNAGHSLEFDSKKIVLHSIPSGIFHPDKLNIIGNGVVLDPVIFRNEILMLEKYNLHPLSNLVISKRSHLILPTHRMLDAASETSKGNQKIGSTLKGIGPVYTDKAGRNGLRAGDILLPDFTGRYAKLKAIHLKLLKQYPSLNLSELENSENEWFKAIEFLKKFRQEDSEYLVNQALNEGKPVLAEGAQGTLLDIDFGSYPFVTSSNTISAGACTGLGVAPNKIGEVFGIFKAYCTRVGSGPFPTELNDSTGEKIRQHGKEFGATTGRPRRCGWLDLPALKYAIMINGVTQLIMTKPDVLSGFDTISVGTSYENHSGSNLHFPFNFQENLHPVYTRFEGWPENITEIQQFQSLPKALKDYISFIETETGIPVSMISTGPDRKHTIFRS